MKTALYLTPRDHGRRLTIDELESAAAQEGYRYELIRGRLAVSPVPDMPHDELKDWLVEQLREYARQRPDLVRRIKAPARVFLPEAREVTAPEPDIAVYEDFPASVPLPERNWRQASPFLVVEVLSPDTAEKDLERNVPLYLAVPTIREYWIVDTREGFDRPSLIVHRRRGQRWQRPILVGTGGTYATRLLPGFSLALDPQAP
jgi:Uma2 family endonuclease